MAELATLATIASALGSVASAGLQIMQAQQAASAASAQAALMQVQARQQELSARSIEQRGQMEALNTREQLLRVLSAQNARDAAAGLVLDEGTPDAVAGEAQRDAERELDVLRTNTTLDAESARIGAAMTGQRALLLQSGTDWTRAAGFLGAAATLGEGAARWYARQPGRAVPPAPGIAS